MDLALPVQRRGSYLGIAEHGYPVKLRFPWTGGPVAGRAAFFPLFPLLIRLTSHLTGGDYPIAGLIVSILAGTAPPSASGPWRPGCATAGSLTVPSSSTVSSRAR